MKKIIQIFTITLTFLIIVTLFSPNINAATKASMVTLKSGVTYTKYDITNDNKKDKIKLIKSKQDVNGGYNKLTIQINNKKYNISSSENYCYYYSLTCKLITLSNNKKFLWIQGTYDNDDDTFEAIYQYKNKKIVKVLDLAYYTNEFSYHHGSTVTKVSGNKIYVKQYMMSSLAANIDFEYVYQYKNGKWSRTSSTAKITDAMYKQNSKSVYGTLKKKRTLYTSPTSNKKKTTLKANTKAKATKVYMSKNNIYIQIQTKNGTVGWVKGNKQFNEDNLLFKECFYAG
jgi:hypothetical protein